MNKKIKTIAEAIKFIEEKLNIGVEEISYKYRIYDEDIDDYCKDDNALIEYANEQMEAIKDE